MTSIEWKECHLKAFLISSLRSHYTPLQPIATFVLHRVLMKIKVFSSHQVFMREKLCMREKYQFVKYSVCHVHFIDGSQKWFTLVNRWIKHGSVAVH